VEVSLALSPVLWKSPMFCECCKVVESHVVSQVSHVVSVVRWKSPILKCGAMKESHVVRVVQWTCPTL
jgi:hypothetical protein